MSDEVEPLGCSCGRGYTYLLPGVAPAILARLACFSRSVLWMMFLTPVAFCVYVDMTVEWFVVWLVSLSTLSVILYQLNEQLSGTIHLDPKRGMLVESIHGPMGDWERPLAPIASVGKVEWMGGHIALYLAREEEPVLIGACLSARDADAALEMLQIWMKGPAH
jgi:hypothetical protein